MLSAKGFQKEKKLTILGDGLHSPSPALVRVVASLSAIRTLTVVNRGCHHGRGEQSRFLKEGNIQFFEDGHSGPSPALIPVILALGCPVVVYRIVKGGGCGCCDEEEIRFNISSSTYT